MNRGKPSVILIGGSLGAFDALKKIFTPLPADLPVPVLVVRHQPADNDDYLLAALNRESRLCFKYAEQGEKPQPGHVYIAPPDYHLLVDTHGLLRLSHSAKVKFSRPAIDPLFISAATFYGASTLAVVLTGANDDGTQGVIEINRRGGTVMVQDPDSAEAPAMPKAALAAIKADYTVWLDQIGPLLWTLLRTPF